MNIQTPSKSCSLVPAIQILAAYGAFATHNLFQLAPSSNSMLYLVKRFHRLIVLDPVDCGPLNLILLNKGGWGLKPDQRYI